MALESIHVSALIPASPQAVYDAWLSSEQHSLMTGAAAQIDPRIGGGHRAWDDYISGRTLELHPGKRIVQSWRSTQFGESGDSLIVVTFEEEGGHTRLQIAHTDIPQGQGAGYQSGWHDHYFKPMIAYFSGAATPAAAAAAKKPAAKRATAKKPAARKPAAKKTAKKPATKKAAVKKSAKKPAAKKPARKAARKSA